MPPRTAVIIATKGRPQEVSNLLDVLATQTVQPDLIIVSVCDPSDVSQSNRAPRNVQLVIGSPGLCAQRNRALLEVRGKYDIVIFFDDDFIPSRFWIERTHALLKARPDVGILTGRVLADGVRSGGIEWSSGQSTVDNADRATDDDNLDDYKIENCKSPYGCNMAFRASVVEDLEFDERLAQYGWLEDRDFGVRAATKSKMIFTDLVWGVHLGTSRGRISGRRYGYSQIVNPWYLMQKGTMTPMDSLAFIASALSRNALGTILRDATIDRWGRFRGNLIGIREIIFGGWAPEKIADL
jgi:GT2 family glycosyltransferase